MFEEAADKQSKEALNLRLLELDSLDERDAVRVVLQNLKEKTGRCAGSWSDIFPLLQNVKLPEGRDFRIDKSNNIVDPSGAPYILDKENAMKVYEKNKKSSLRAVNCGYETHVKSKISKNYESVLEKAEIRAPTIKFAGEAGKSSVSRRERRGKKRRRLSF